jgi:DNA invertase Pin-like site-specific DNA recombinase
MTRTWTVCRQLSRVATATAGGIRPISCWCAGPSQATCPGRRRSPGRCLMRVAIYARVSTTRQAQAQTIQQQLDRLRAAVAERGWTLEEEHVYRDDGYSGAGLSRPGLDRLRDHAALAELDLVLVTAPDRLARNYVHQVLLLDELGRHGLKVEFLDRPMSHDPHDQLLLQIRGAVAEYERTLIAERMRRGRQAKLRAGTGPRRRSATAWTPNALVMWPGCGWSRPRRCWSRSCLTGTWSHRRPCTGWPSG